MCGFAGFALSVKIGSLRACALVSARSDRARPHAACGLAERARRLHVTGNLQRACRSFASRSESRRTAVVCVRSTTVRYFYKAIGRRATPRAPGVAQTEVRGGGQRPPPRSAPLLTSTVTPYITTSRTPARTTPGRLTLGRCRAVARLARARAPPPPLARGARTR